MTEKLFPDAPETPHFTVDFFGPYTFTDDERKDIYFKIASFADLILKNNENLDAKRKELILNSLVKDIETLISKGIEES